MQKDLLYGIRLDPVFSITQADRKPLELVIETINAGRIIRKPGQKHLYLLVIDNMEDLVNKLIPFLDKYQDLLYVKKKSYMLFREIVLALSKGLHKNFSTLKELVFKAYKLSSLSSKAHRRRNFDEIIEIIDSHIAKRRDLPGER